MSKTLLPLLLGTTLVVSACTNLTGQDRANIGLLGGAAGGFLLAEAFDANEEWTILSTVAGAAAGTVVARSTTNSNNCAYSNGDGTYTVAPCPG